MANTKKWVVIVDDDEDLQELLVFAFKKEGFQVKQFLKGSSALDYLSTEKNVKSAALLILDRILPDMDGLDILKKFYAKSSVKIPVLILSVLSAEKDVLAGLKGGAVDYVVKPFSLPILMEKALALVARAEK